MQFPPLFSSVLIGQVRLSHLGTRRLVRGFRLGDLGCRMGRCLDRLLPDFEIDEGGNDEHGDRHEPLRPPLPDTTAVRPAAALEKEKALFQSPSAGAGDRIADGRVTLGPKGGRPTSSATG